MLTIIVFTCTNIDYLRLRICEHVYEDIRVYVTALELRRKSHYITDVACDTIRNIRYSDVTKII